MSFHLTIAFAETISPYAYNAEAKLLKQQLFESTSWYSNVGSYVWNYVSPVSFEFPIGKIIFGIYIPAWPSILRRNSRL